MGRARVGAFALFLFLFIVIPIGLACGGDDVPALPTKTLEFPSPSLTPALTPASPGQSEPPERDLLDLARRFRGLPADAIPLARLTPHDHRRGDTHEFTLFDLDMPRTIVTKATLALVTEHAYFFVEEGIPLQDLELEAIGADFEARVYPWVTAAFGSESSPGVDSDPRITILHAALSGVGGYVTSSDAFPRAAVPHSNEREMLYLDSSLLFIGSGPQSLYSIVAAHELQHLVHANADPGEEAWVNEGLSQVASELVVIAPGANTFGLQSFLVAPDTQLDYWPAAGDIGVHYAASQLFFSYLLDHFGGRENAFRLLSVPEDGIAGLEVYLAPFDVTFLDVFANWLVANYLDEEDGPYSHAAVSAKVATVTSIRSPGPGSGSVHQFAADYLELELSNGPATFTFEGVEQVSIGVPNRDGPFWWSSRGDGIDSRLTRELDLRGVETATLRFQSWFDIEAGWDYAYVAASTDGGLTWRALDGRHTVDDDPVGQAYGPGYTGTSGGREPQWVQEEIDLTSFAGQVILLRFEYVTDDATNLTGFAVDDIEVLELGVLDPVDTADAWTVEGFRRVEGTMEQQYLLLLIRPGDLPIVTRVKLDSHNRATVLLEGPATIVVAAITEGTTEIAPYSWTLTSPLGP